MGYQKDHVALYSPQEGYNLLAKKYRTYHSRMTAWEGGIFTRFLPRSLKDIGVLDVGSGDARMAQYFVGAGVERYDAMDCAALLLQQSPRWVHRIHADMNEAARPLESGSYAVVLAFFCQMYVTDWDSWFGEVVRCLTPDGRCILQYHKERREYIHDIGKERFKIAAHYWPEDVLVSAAADHGLVDYPLTIPERQGGGTIHCFMLS